MTPREASPRPWKFVPDPDPAATNCGAIVDACGAVVCAVGWAGDDGWCSAPSPADMRAIVEAVNDAPRLLQHRNEWADEAERHRLAVVKLRAAAASAVLAARDALLQTGLRIEIEALSRAVDATAGDEVHGQ